MGVTATASTGSTPIAPPPASAPAPGSRKGSVGKAVVIEEVKGVAKESDSSSAPTAMGGENVDPNEQSEPPLVDESSEPALTEQPAPTSSSSQLDKPFATTYLDALVEAGSSELQCKVPEGCVIGMLIVIGEGLEHEEVRYITGFASILIDIPLSHTHPIGTIITIYDPNQFPLAETDKPAPTASSSEPPLPVMAADQPGEGDVIDVNDPTATATATATLPEAEVVAVENNGNTESAVDVDTDGTTKVVDGDDLAGGGGVAGTVIETVVEDEEKKEPLESPQPDSSPLAPASDLEQQLPPSDYTTTDIVTADELPIDPDTADATEGVIDSVALSNVDDNVNGTSVESVNPSLSKAASFSAVVPKKGTISGAPDAGAIKRKHGSVATIPQVRKYPLPLTPHNQPVNQPTLTITQTQICFAGSAFEGQSSGVVVRRGGSEGEQGPSSIHQRPGRGSCGFSNKQGHLQNHKRQSP